jgi:cytochrome c biogenesis protein
MIEAQVAGQPAAIRTTRRADVADEVWRALASPRLALFLILAIAAACVVGALVVQVPAEVLRSPESTRSWIERAARPKLGGWTDLFQTLGLLWVFQTAWFHSLLALLTASTVVCTLNRLPSLWHGVFQPLVRPREGLYDRGEPRATATLAGVSLSEARQDLVETLRHGHYRVVETREVGGTYLYADRFRLARFGTLLTHGALILIMAGAVLQQPLGYFEEPGFAVPIGSTRAVGHDTGLSIQVDDFADEYLPSGQPKDYRSDVVLFDQGRVVAHQTVRVNDPLVYNGVRFHQSFFGQSVLLSIKDRSTGTSLFHDAVPLTWKSDDGVRAVGYFDLPIRDLHVYLVGTGGDDDPIVRPGEVLVEAYQGTANTPTYRVTLTQHQPLSVAGLDVQFEREVPFTGLRVVRDPGALLIWLASALLIAGLAVTFYVPTRRLWARVRPGRGGAEIVLIGAGRDMARHVERLAANLPGDTHGA